MTILEYMKDNILYLDGGMGTLLQDSGLAPGELPESWNLSHPEVIQNLHRTYFDAGSNVVNTNTFGANSLKFSYSELESIIKAAVLNAKRQKTLLLASRKNLLPLTSALAASSSNLTEI